MKKIKNIFAFVIITVLIHACGNSSTTTLDDFDHEAQALVDNDTLVQFLQNHYYDTSVDSVKAIISGQEALIDNVESMKITENEIDYTLYYFVKKQGTPTIDKGNPTVMDSVYVKYNGQRIVETDSISGSFDSNNGIWITLNGVIRGWAHGFTKFKGGDNVTNNGPITYENGGRGILFIPSGLAYSNIGSGSILANECLMFNIDLYEFVKDTDHDNDGIASIYEDPDGNNDSRDDDTDEDGTPNFFDTDDDGDGVLTINEDANGDGNPANDFSDPNNPTLPDYLNPDIN
ncbi:MAG: FKBP-type peptidyl-prolyl cis-trans isomerase [Polaribacter sp.]|uniref:FKBP-type peptidyl-prolyl cis-trans isomerase n=1 Tax=Polaribacter sp. TaxID=1920175 RepID=UPI0032669DAC